MRFGLILVVALAIVVALAVIPRSHSRLPCESGAWQEEFGNGGYEQVCMTLDRPDHDPLPSFSYSLDV